MEQLRKKDADLIKLRVVKFTDSMEYRTLEKYGKFNYYINDKSIRHLKGLKPINNIYWYHHQNTFNETQIQDYIDQLEVHKKAINLLLQENESFIKENNLDREVYHLYPRFKNSFLVVNINQNKPNWAIQFGKTAVNYYVCPGQAALVLAWSSKISQSTESKIIYEVKEQLIKELYESKILKEPS